MRSRRLVLLSVPVVLAISAACGSSEPKQAESPRALASADAWERTPHRAEWLYATADVSGTHTAECEHVLGFMQHEEGCEGGACAHAHALAEEWLARCPKVLPGAVSEVKDLDVRWRAAVREPATPCGQEAETILRDGCGADAACTATAQKWATRCGEKGTTPLVVRMVERAVERRSGERKVKLDLRGCDALRAEVAKSTRCSHRFQCADALASVETWRARCDGADAPRTLLEAMLPRLVLAAADRPDLPPVKLARDAATVAAGDVPLPLADGSGAVVSVCGDRVLDLPGYLAAREKCQGGTVAIVKAWPTAGRQVEVRAAKLPHADLRTFERSFPSVLVAGEREARDARDAKVLGAELDEAAKLSQSSPGDAVAALVRALVPRANDLRRSAALRQVVTAHDDALAPVLREIGARKAKAARGKLTISELVGLVQRGTSAALADLDASGVVQPGAGALDLDTVETLPVATAAYRQAFAPAHKTVRGKKIDVHLLSDAIDLATRSATECGAEEKGVDDLEHRLLACASGRGPCEDGLDAELEKARAAAEAARARVLAAMTGVAVTERDRLADAAAQAGCLEPWW